MQNDSNKFQQFYLFRARSLSWLCLRAENIIERTFEHNDTRKLKEIKKALNELLDEIKKRLKFCCVFSINKTYKQAPWITAIRAETINFLDLSRHSEMVFL